MGEVKKAEPNIKTRLPTPTFENLNLKTEQLNSWMIVSSFMPPPSGLLCRYVRFIYR